MRDTLLKALGVIALVSGALLLWYTTDALLVFFAAGLVCVFLSGLAKIVRNHTGLGTESSVTCVLVGLFLLIGMAMLLVGPAIAQQSTLLSTALPKASGDLVKSLQQSPFGASAIEGVKRAMEASSANNWQSTVKFAGLTIHGLGGLFFAVALGIFMSYQPNLYRDGLIDLFPKSKRARIAQVLDELDFTLWWWLMGQLFTMASVGILIGVGLTILGVPLSGTLGLMAAVLAFIPSLGPLISVIPALILGFSISPAVGFWVIGLYAAVQFLEANVISPLVQLRAISLPPALILGSELVMGLLFGGSGLAVATPLAATCLVLVNMLYIQDVLGDPGSLPSDARKARQKRDTKPKES